MATPSPRPSPAWWRSSYLGLWCSICVSIVVHVRGECTGPINQVEFDSLETLYNATQGSQWKWDESAPASTIWSFPNTLSAPCIDEWQGVICNQTFPFAPDPNLNCSVTFLWLTEYGLSGELAKTNIWSMTALEKLYLDGNSLSKTIPSQLGLMTRLEQLFLDVNCLSGTIPSEMGNLSSVIEMALDVNSLSGSIPSSLGQLSALKFVYLDDSCITGVIPTELGLLSSLAQMYFDINWISGPIPSELGRLSGLKQLGLYTNLLTNSLASELGQLQKMEQLYLFENYLDGPLSAVIGQMTALQSGSLNFNFFTGQLTSELSSLSYLYYFNANSNLLSGSISSVICQLSSLDQLFLSDNSLEGSIPTEIGLLTVMQQLGLENNRLTNTLPSEIGLLTALQQLFLNTNSFVGTLSTELGNLVSLEVLTLYSNRLTASLPTELGLLSELGLAALFGNSFSGELPTELGLLTFLEVLVVDGNLLTGDIDAINTMDGMLVLNVSLNYFSAELPSFPSNIKFVDLSSNLLHGAIANSLESCKHTQFLVFSFNMLSSSIPSYFSSMHSLQALNLSSNRLSGHIDSLSIDGGNSSLYSVDVSSNLLAGTLPPKFFVQANLSTILLYENCFSGSLPTSLCENTALQTLFLDELTGNCGSLLPNGFKSFMKGFFPKQLIKGGIPSCIWSMSQLELLQLSGNGLTGTLGDIDVSNSSLKTLLLASNRLSGTIPVSLQTSGQFIQLDLRGNKLSGTLNSGFAVNPKANVLDFSINRLSGRIPASFDNVTSLNVLSGNLFQCQENNIPSDDPDAATYICGSDNFNQSLEFAVVALFLSLAIAITALAYRNWLSLAMEFEKINLKIIRQHAAVMVVVAYAVATVLVIFYSSFKAAPLLADQYSTHSEQYLWTSTVAYLHGAAPPAMVLIVLFATAYIFSSAEKYIGTGDAAMALPPADSSSDDNPAPVSRKILRIALLHLTNIVLVVTVNGLYVGAILQGLSQDKLLVTQFFLGCFKMIWNFVAIPTLSQYIGGAGGNLPHRLFMSLFSMIGGPFISTFFTAKNCFLGAFVGESAIVSTSQVAGYGCQNLCSITCNGNVCYESCATACGFYTGKSIEISMTPPWLYSYQCSSSLVKDYVPVFVLSYVTTGLVFPIICLFVFAPPQVWNAVDEAKNRMTEFATRKTLSKRQESPERQMSASLSQKLEPLVRGESIRRKMLGDVAVLMTFGIASPLLAVLLATQSAMLVLLLHFAVGRLVEVISHDAEPEIREKELKQRLLFLKIPALTIEYFIVFCFVGAFWCLFVFDMIGDVRGNLAGGLSILIPLCIPIIFWIMHSKTVSALTFSERLSSLIGIELKVKSPGVVPDPQNSNDLSFQGNNNIGNDML
jgi:Leucine-rich repeat (LRR) protein